MADTGSETDTLNLATELTVAWLGNPNTRVSADEVPSFLGAMHAALASLSSGQQTEQTGGEQQTEYTPAVSVRKSLASPDHLISMIDGKPYKTLRRHLARHGLTPEQYRERFGLKPDYPMTSANYSQVRRDMAKRIGLGRKPGDGASAFAGEPTGAAEQVDSSAAATPARGRRRKAEAGS